MVSESLSSPASLFPVHPPQKNIPPHPEFCFCESSDFDFVCFCMGFNFLTNTMNNPNQINQDESGCIAVCVAIGCFCRFLIGKETRGHRSLLFMEFSIFAKSEWFPWVYDRAYTPPDRNGHIVMKFIGCNLFRVETRTCNC